MRGDVALTLALVGDGTSSWIVGGHNGTMPLNTSSWIVSNPGRGGHVDTSRWIVSNPGGGGSLDRSRWTMGIPRREGTIGGAHAGSTKRSGRTSCRIVLVGGTRLLSLHDSSLNLIAL